MNIVEIDDCKKKSLVLQQSEPMKCPISNIQPHRTPGTAGCLENGYRGPWKRRPQEYAQRTTEFSSQLLLPDASRAGSPNNPCLFLITIRKHFAGSPFSRSQKRRPPRICFTIYTILMTIDFTWRQWSGKSHSFRDLEKGDPAKCLQN